MKFIIQKNDNEINYDYCFILVKSIKIYNLYYTNNKIKYIYYNKFRFKPYHKEYIPVGDVNFVNSFLYQFFKIKIKPINIPIELYGFSGKKIINDTHKILNKLSGEYIVNSNSSVTGFFGIVNCDNKPVNVPIDTYQISQHINFNSEWRAFVYQKHLVGLYNYWGDFTKYPNVNRILTMINSYKSSPCAYCLDVGVDDNNTYIISVNGFYSCDLYGFSNYYIIPIMFSKWFREYVKYNSL